MNRRTLLRLSGLGALSLLLRPPPAAAAPVGAHPTAPARGLGPIRPADLTLAPGLRSRVIARLGDRIGGFTFGSDADFTAVLPLPSGNVLLFVGHEFPPYPLERFATHLGRAPTAEDTLDCMGASILELRPAAAGGWELVPDSPRAWRLTGRTPDTLPTGPAAALLGARVPGTFQNCGGGTTPWGTVLSCEENVRYQVREGVGTRTGKVGVGPLTTPVYPDPKLPGEAYGWVVEVDPADASWSPRRHTALGRFRHESAVFLPAKAGQPLSVVMGDDRVGGSLWRFRSRSKWRTGLNRDAASALLHDGTLEVLALESASRGRWRSVSRASPIDGVARAQLPGLAASWGIPADFIAALASAQTLGDLYDSEAAVLVDAWLAGLLAGGTPLGRPEGCTVHDGGVAVALTRNLGLGAGHPWTPPVEHAAGCVLHLRERGGHVELRTLAIGGGAAAGGADFASPDNLASIDGALLIATDAEAPAEGHAANALLRVHDGAIERLLVAPPEAEVCGPSAAPDGAIFCTIQHPAASWGESCLLCVWPG